ncbi:MAG: MAE_28990/MAE_18760 family HEPN-like nuclease [bacterium]|nr:MAE_28990/MAE_18760 family HEPN-like nuclease [bacterium]
MNDVRQDYEERVQEIHDYLALIYELEIGTIDFIIPANAQKAFDDKRRRNLLRTFKASTYLMLYNLMESAVISAICAIYDEMETRGVDFDACRSEIRKIVLQNLKNHQPQTIVGSLNKVALDIITKTYQRSKIASGNVDAQKIREIATEYGIKHPRADGSMLVAVKRQRQDLAHGVKSFADVGRDTTVTELVELTRQVTAYLTLLIDNVAEYINDQQYLSVNVASASLTAV